MHAFLFLCSLLLCNGVTVAAQKKIQKLPDEEEESLPQIRTPQTLSRGWGDDIEWAQTYEEGLARSKNSKKPLMVIYHLEECPYSQGLLPKSVSDHSLSLDNLLGYREQSEVCQGSLAPPRLMKLLKAFASSPEIQQMAQEDFIMLNLVHSSSDDNMAPDGHYVPRILFVDPSMTVRADLTGKYGNRMYAYEPEDISTLIENMRQAKLLLRTEL